MRNVTVALIASNQSTQFDVCHRHSGHTWTIALICIELDTLLRLSAGV